MEISSHNVPIRMDDVNDMYNGSGNVNQTQANA